MNYFEIFELPVQFNIDKAELTRRFIELSRKYHPDYFAREAREIQMEALNKSAQLNRAYKTLQDKNETIRYILTIKGLMEEEEKYDLPPSFLGEVMDINEQLMDSGDSHALPGLQLVIDNLEQEIYEPVKQIVEHYQEGITTEKELLQVKDYYFKKKYLDRIRREITRQ